MIIKSLKLENYKQYKNIELTFKEGLVGVIGKNGAGKSTIFDAILYCLYGKDENNKSLVRSTYSNANSNVELTLVFELELQEFKIMRGFKGKALTAWASLYKDDILIAKDTRPVNEEVAKLLNMEREAFKRSVFSGQKELTELSDTSGEARKKMIRRMVGLETLDEIQIEINGDAKSFRNQIIGQTLNLLTEEALSELKETISYYDLQKKEKHDAKFVLQNLLKETEEALNSHKIIFKQEEEKYNKVNEYTNSITEFRGRIEELNNNLSTLREKLSEIERMNTQCNLLKPKMIDFEGKKVELSTMQRIYDKKLNRNYYSNRQKALKEQLSTINTKIEELKPQTVNITNLISANEKCIKIINEKKEQYQNQVASRENILNIISSIQGKIADRNEKIAKIEQIGKSGSCPTCLQSLFNAYDSTIKNLLQDIEQFQQGSLIEKRAEVKLIEIAVKTLTTEVINLENQQKNFIKQISTIEQIQNTLAKEEVGKIQIIKEINELQVKIDEFGELILDDSKFESYKKDIVDLEPQYLNFKKTENYVSTELPLTKSSIESCQNQINLYKEKINASEVNISVLNFSLEYYEKVKVEKANIEENLNAKREELYQKELEIKEVENNIFQNKQKLDGHYKILEQIAEKTKEIDTLEKLSALIGEFKTNILEKISPNISHEASKLFNRITKGKYENIKVDENFDFFIMDNSSYYPINRFSGGEIDLGNFCLRIAITKAIADLNGSKNNLNFLAFDEIFGSQDEDRRYEIMLALNFLQEQFRQIYIISHVETVKEYFPNILEVTLGANGSQVNWI